MATNETSFRAEVRLAALDLGYHACSNAAEFDAGKPDLYIKAPPYVCGHWIETKWETNKPTRLQVRWMLDEIRAGGTAYVLKGRKAKDKMIWRAYIKPLYVEGEWEMVSNRLRGEPWDVLGIMRAGYEISMRDHLKMISDGIINRGKGL